MHVFVVDSLPHLPSHKLDREAAAKIATQKIHGTRSEAVSVSASVDMPATATELAIAQIWRTILNTTSVSVSVNR